MELGRQMLLRDWMRRMRKTVGLGTLGHCLSLGEKLYWRGESGGDSVAGVGVVEVKTICIDCPFKKFGKGRQD